MPTPVGEAEDEKKQDDMRHELQVKYTVFMVN